MTLLPIYVIFLLLSVTNLTLCIKCNKSVWKQQSCQNTKLEKNQCCTEHHSLNILKGVKSIQFYLFVKSLQFYYIEALSWTNVVHLIVKSLGGENKLISDFLYLYKFVIPWSWWSNDKFSRIFISNSLAAATKYFKDSSGTTVSPQYINSTIDLIIEKSHPVMITCSVEGFFSSSSWK